MQESRELIDAVIAGRRPARTPIFDLLMNDAVIEYFADARLDGTDDAEVVYRAVGNTLDGSRCVAPPGREGATWTDEAGNTRITQRWTSWLQQPAFSTVEQWAAWMRQYVDRAEEGRDPSGRLGLTEADANSSRREVTAAEQRRLNDALGGTVHIHCQPSTTLNALIHYLGLDTLSYLWMDHRELVERWLRIYVRETINYIDVTAHPDLCPLAIIYSDVAYNHGPMFSRAMFRDMGFFDEVAELCNACHRRGMTVIFHSDGDIQTIMADLAATGIDGLNPIEAAAGMDVFDIHQKYPGLILVGGVDVTHLLRTESSDDIRRQTRRMIDEIGTDGRLLIGSSTEVGNDVPLDKYLTFHEEVVRN